MVENLTYYAEKRAEEAENLRIFSGLKLLHIKKQVEVLLSHIGDNDIFSEYTKHNISHIDEMLKIVEWIIPEKTKEILSASEWMMLVLSIYFHDMGMLVTKEEYANREKTDFVSYRKSAYNGDFGLEYAKKINNLEDPDKFLYQEYVRKNHAKRIKMWISGELDENFHFTKNIADEIQKLMSSIDTLFKHDLAIICESHHLYNLDDYSIYDTNKCYESSDEGKVNLQYIAVILRTVDLLHITMDRTPAIECHLFCPTDPVSIIEWQKQMAIRAVKPTEMRNEDGDVDKTLQSDSISVTAYFEEANQAEAFFALMDYLRYVKSELQTNYDLIQNSIKKQGTDEYLYPWKNVDDKGIKTKNFSNHLLKFELDQNSILQMLVGHTLYNDSSVVIRELVQNGLDAIKLQNDIERKSKKALTKGQIKVSLDNENNILSFTDNGTGMTVFEIENYLLKVGTSKYSSKAFQKEHPDFVSISRFGIGILTCFLVADDIEIATCSSENNESNRIFFRNVDGKYLLKSMQKEELPNEIRKHGTQIKLHLRENISFEKLEYSLKKWIVFPYCEVLLTKSETEHIKIGYTSPKHALEDYIGKITSHTASKLKVEEVEVDGITLAYALQYREPFQEYSLVENSKRNNINDHDAPAPIGVCFEGIRVASNTPGYKHDTFLAIMNSNNNKVVKTNVARSSIEENDGKSHLLKIIYTIYRKHVENQIETFISKGKSLSWIASEVRYLVNQLVASRGSELDGNILEEKKIFKEIFGDLESILFEDNCKRQLVSAKFLQSLDKINMSESNMIKAAEYLLKETKTNISLGGLVNTIVESEKFEAKNMICDFDQQNLLHKMAISEKNVESIIVNKDDRKIDLFFNSDEKKWYEFSLISSGVYEFYGAVYLPKNTENIIVGLDDDFGVKTKLGVFLNGNNELAKYICEKKKHFDCETSNLEEIAFKSFLSMIVNKQNNYISRERGQDFFAKNFLSRMEREILERVSDEIKDVLWNKIDRDELITVLYNHKAMVFDLNDWSRKERV